MTVKHVVSALLMLLWAAEVTVHGASIIATTNTMARPRAHYITKNGDFLYVAHTEEDELEIIDVSALPALTVLDSLDTQGTLDGPGRISVNAARTTMHVPYAGSGKIKQYDISTVPMMETASVVRYSQRYSYLDEMDDTLFVASDGSTGMSSIQVSSYQLEISKLSFKARGFTINTNLDLAYGTESGKVHIADISNAFTTMDILSTTNILGTGEGVYNVNEFVYVASSTKGPWTGGIHILDATNTMAPTILAELDLSLNCNDVVWSSNTLYVACEGAVVGTGGVAVVDVTDKAMPSFTELIQTPGRPRGLVFTDPYIFVAAFEHGVHVIDINAAGPTAVPTVAPDTLVPPTQAPPTVSPATPVPPTPAPDTPVPPTPSPATPVPPTPAPPTPAPPTPAPPTPVPPTDSPPTPAPPTPVPPTPAPATPVPPTPAPDTPAPVTPAPPTPAPATPAPPTPSPPTPVPPTDSPPTPAPPTPAPATPVPPTPAPDTPAPITPAPDTPAPATPAPPTPSPPTPVPPTDSPPTSAPLTPAPDTPAPLTPVPPTLVPPTLAPSTPFPSTPAPDTLAPDTPSPDTPAPITPSPPTPAPPTQAPDTPVPDTSAPATVSPPTPVPPTSAPDTPAPDTLPPSTPAPATLAPDTAVPDTPAPDTQAPPTSVPPTQAPLTPAPDTLAPPTLAPLTPVPDTQAPATQAPPTSAPLTAAPTLSPPTSSPATLAPDTQSPATLAPDTLVPGTTAAPPTPSPDTAVPTTAPDTPFPATASPATPLPDTSSPDTPAPATDPPDTLVPGTTAAPPTPAPDTAAPTTAPDTPFPATASPPTPFPETSAPSTPAPNTVAPMTVQPAPPTSAPPTLVPLTQPPTSSPPTVPPSTFVPNTDAPPTTAPATLTPTQTPTSTPATAIPPTALPTAAPPVTASPDGKRFQCRIHPERFTGDVIRGDGGTIRFRLLGRLLEYGSGVPLLVVLIWPGGSMTFGNSGSGRGGRVLGGTPPVTCGGGACVILETDKAPDAAGVGFVASSKQNEEAVTAKVSNGRDGVDLMIRDGNYTGFEGKGEVVAVLLREELLGASSAFVCGNAADGMECECGVGCKVTVQMNGEPNILPNHEQLEGTTAAATASVTVVASVVPASASAGPALVRASLVQRMMLCPSDGTTKLDRTLNPLGLTIGSGVNKEVNGALVGSLAIQLALVLAAGTAVTIVRSRRPGESTLYILARARVGWSLIPIQFLFGGSVLSCFAALLYSTMGFKVLAAVDLAVFPGLFATYAWRVGKTVPRRALVDNLPTGGGILQWAFWGKEEWVSKKQEGDGVWCGLNGLSYDAYRPGIFRYYLCWELLTTFLMGIVSAWEPLNSDQCMTKAGITATILGVMLLVLLLRPYIAPYENFLDTCVVGMELVVTILITVALGSSHPTDHWTAGVAGQLSMVIVYVILLKFVIDLVVFVVDEYCVWDEKGRKGSFVAHFLCCGNSIEEDVPDDSLKLKGSINIEELQPVHVESLEKFEEDLMGGSAYSNYSHVLNKSSLPQTPRTPPLRHTHLGSASSVLLGTSRGAPSKRSFSGRGKRNMTLI